MRASPRATRWAGSSTARRWCCSRRQTSRSPTASPRARPSAWASPSCACLEGDLLAHVPQSPRQRIVLCGLGQRPPLAAIEIFPAGPRNVRRGGEPYQRLGALLLRPGKQFGDAQVERRKPAGLVAEPGRDEAGAEAVRGHAASHEAARELAREQDVAEL